MPFMLRQAQHERKKSTILTPDPFALSLSKGGIGFIRYN